jgi:hypothetical protein
LAKIITVIQRDAKKMCCRVALGRKRIFSETSKCRATALPSGTRQHVIARKISLRKNEKMKAARRNILLHVALAFSFSLMAGAADFAKDIQPIFSRHCYECHGTEKQKGDLRLDQRTSALRTGTNAVIVAGKPEQSDLYRRITLSKGDDDIMPHRGEPLTKAETDLIRSWISEGAVWPENVVAAKHWSYVKPVRPIPPKTKNKTWAKNEIDQFILARLEKENLQPSPEADRATLLRRVYLDLIGLPPSPEDVQKFLADKSPDAYERVVDRLLSSKQYGVRWARPWLDLARYADSSGYQRDDLWSLWPYRDWVINALNANIPFDEFTIEQIAGDLLPNATLDQKIATGFNRCTPINVEAGSDQEESRVNQILDRVNTVGTVWLGSTIQCCQCHNHKYDPFTQKDYYQLFAFFNNTPQESKFANPNTTIALRFNGPYLKLPNAKVEKQRDAVQKKIDAIKGEMESAHETLLAGQSDWEKKTAGQLGSLTQTHALDIAEFDADSNSPYEILADKSVLLRNDENAAAPQNDTYTIKVHSKLTGITGFKVEALTDPSLSGNGPGRGNSKRPNFVLTEFEVTASSSGENAQPVKFGKTRASFEQKNFSARQAIDDDPKSGWGISPQFFKDHWAIFQTKSPVGSSAGTTFIFTLKQNYGGGRMIGRIRLSAITGDPNSDGIPTDIAAILTTASNERTKKQRKRLENFYLGQQPQMKEMKTALAKLETELKNVKPPETLPMVEMDKPRESTIFVRGNFLTKGDVVQPDVPEVLPPIGDGVRNRLTLARWLVSTNNPLTARVTVNRWWAEFFGQGIVTTPEDFGIKGDLPTHPELLDWLACEFMNPLDRESLKRDSLNSENGTLHSDSTIRRINDSTVQRINDSTAQRFDASTPHAWDMKHIHRLIVMSATYRQSSRITPELRERDDQNKLYARGPRFRLDAEMIRDNALSAAGLLSLKMGGPPVRPYQPPGIWESKVGGVRVNYEISEGEDRYRRGVYTVWKRTSPYPSFITFDAPNRNTCTVRRPRSNTPLQALTLLNDPVYVEASVALAKRVLKEKPDASLEEKIRHAFELCLSRAPRESELKTLLQLYKEQLDASKNSSDAAKKLGGEFAKPENVDAAEFAAWFSVASTLLNLDEMITKG